MYWENLCSLLGKKPPQLRSHSGIALQLGFQNGKNRSASKCQKQKLIARSNHFADEVDADPSA